MTINSNTLIAANRFGLGARPGELASIDSDPRGWLLAQLAGTPPLPEPLRSLPSSADIFQRYVEGQREKREAKMEVQSAAATNSDAERAEKQVTGVRKILAPIYLDQVAGRYRVAATAADPFRERLVHFWTNHFAISADKVAVTALAGAFENEAIRPNISNHFFDLLLAVETHPAMLLYLDNQASTGADSRLATMAARRAQSDRKIGINENLAREILELHTLDVDGGYTRADVTTFAGAITGWSIGGGRGRLAAGEPGKFIFRPAMHEPGVKTILGKRYGDDGFDQGRAVLRDLAHHPATAHHIAIKLVRHFVADDPPAIAVEHIAKVFRSSDGHLPTVHRAIVELSDAWTAPFAKFKTPHDFVISTYRAFDFVPTASQQIFGSFQLLGQRPYTPGSPAGWPDVASQWDGPDALMKRIEWSTVVGQRTTTRQSPLVVADAALSSGLGDHSRTVISRAASPAQGFALLLASPEFQRR